MLTKELFSGEMILNKEIDNAFNYLEKQALDQTEIILDFNDLSFISVYFLESLESFIKKIKGLNLGIKIINMQPSIYKVFQVARIKNILEVCS